ncbi:Transcription factor 15 [Orchesella cincta]|uniref:Transcription factor 15 n=1 Tax=Orchesella cincta TaxID=48709 RepID=A0A1D2N484_ORCCI|nr:Transcription factor 15 [Orchesella cincta]
MEIRERSSPVEEADPVLKVNNNSAKNPKQEVTAVVATEKEKKHKGLRIWISVNTAFTTLRSLIPTEPVDRKLSKIETLRLASSYISHLSCHVLLEESSSDERCGDSSGLLEESPPTATKICTFCLSDSKKMQARCEPQLPSNNWYYQSLQDNHHQLNVCGLQHELPQHRNDIVRDAGFADTGINAYY